MALPDNNCRRIYLLDWSSLNWPVVGSRQLQTVYKAQMSDYRRLTSLLGLLDTEEEGNTILRNVGYQSIRRYIPGGMNHERYYSKNLKSSKTQRKFAPS